MLDARRLLVLREVAAHGSVSGAARALGYTPSAISQQVAALEREAGVRLVERTGRGIRLTEPARTLVPHANEVFAALERAAAALVAASGDLSGTVRLASFPTATKTLLPASLAALRRAYPRLRIELSELEPVASLPALALGEVDLVVAHEYSLQARHPARDLHRVDLLEEPMLLVGGAGGDGPAPLTEEADSDWILPLEGSACGELVRRACNACGFEPRAVARSSDFAAMCALAASGVGVALIPLIGVSRLPGLSVRPVEPPVGRRIFGCTRRGAERHPRLAATLAALTAHRADAPETDTRPLI